MKKQLFLLSLMLGFMFIANVTFAVGKGWLGVSIREMTPSMREEYKLGERSGLLVVDVARNSPADDAGLREDDVILKYDGQPVEIAGEFSKLVRNTEPGKTVKLLVFRDGEEKDFEVEIAKRKSRVVKPAYWGGKHFAFCMDRPRLGVVVHALNEDLAPYFKVEKNSGALISQVMEDSPAEAAGLKAGDVITKIDDEKISGPEDLYEALEQYEGGDKVMVEYIRKDAAEKVEVELEDEGFRDFRIDIPRIEPFDALHFERAPRIPAPPTIIHKIRTHENVI